MTELQTRTKYAYDANSNRVGYTAPDGSTNAYAYDTLNRMTSLTNSWAGSFGFSYDALGRRTQLTRPNNVTTSYSYNSLSRLVSVLHQLSGSTIDGAVYTVDSAGNRTSKADELANVTTNYGYDSIYELLQATQGSTTTESYTYDPVGNRLSSLGVSSYTNNSSNELTSTSNASYTYDYNGNTTSKTDSTGTTNYTWDYENRLTEVTLPNSGGTVTFKYDPFGRRIEKISPTATSIFAYDGPNLIETVNASGVVVARYTQTENVDEPLAMQRGTTTSYYEQDGLGSVTSLSASAGTLAQSYTYDSFGNTTNSSGSLTNFLRYTGREFDTETGLYYYRARYYDPAPGRFISEDPFLFGPNFYMYAGNNPTDALDPFGLKCIQKIMLITAYCTTGPGTDWPFFKPKTHGGKPGSVGPGTVAVADTVPPAYPFGSSVSVSGDPDPVFHSQPTDPFNTPAYVGCVHDTGKGWDPKHHNVPPDSWLDIWLPCAQAKQWGKQWRMVTICTPDGGCGCQ